MIVAKFTEQPIQIIFTNKQAAHISGVLEQSIALAGENNDLIVKGAVGFKEPGQYRTSIAIGLNHKR